MGNAPSASPSSPAFGDVAPSMTPTIKILIAKEAQVVIFAEAGKDVVDFLVGLLAMPVAAVVKLLAGENTLGGVANVYSSVRRMDASYMQSLEARDALLNPAPAHPALAATAGGFPSLVRPPAATPAQPTLPLPPQVLPPCPLRGHPRPIRTPPCMPMPTGVTMPSLKGFGAATDAHCRCAACVAATQGSKGFVRDAVTYTIMDDLTITPMSSISSLTLLSKLGVEDLSALEEKTIKIGYQEGVEILKASLQSKTVLTDVFLSKKKRARTTVVERHRSGDKHHKSGDKTMPGDKNMAGDKNDGCASGEQPQEQS